MKIAQYALDRWLDLREYIPVEETRSTLTLLNRQYSAICKHKTQLINNLISLIDQSFPNVNEFFDSPPRQSDGHMKWVDFIIKFPHRDCVSGISRAAFKDKYSRWYKKQNYNYAEEKADEIYDRTRSCVATLPDSECVRAMIQQLAMLLNCTLETAESLRKLMTATAEQLPEYDTVPISFAWQSALLCLLASNGKFSAAQRRKSFHWNYFFRKPVLGVDFS